MSWSARVEAGRSPEPVAVGGRAMAGPVSASIRRWSAAERQPAHNERADQQKPRRGDKQGARSGRRPA